METNGGSEGTASRISTSTLQGAGRSASRPGRFTPPRNNPQNFVHGQVGPIAGFEAVERRMSLPCQEYNPGSLAVQPEDLSRLRLDESNYLNLEF
jgi:hypothetical protein